MAVEINILQRNLTRDACVELKSMLKVVSKKTFKYNNQKCIDFYSVYADSIYVPYRLGVNYLNHNPNAEYDFLERQVEFTGHLRVDDTKDQVALEEQCWNLLSKTGTCIAQISTGVGKSVLAAHMSSRVNGITCILLPTKTIDDQWVNVYKKNTNANIWLTKNRCPDDIPDVIVSTIGQAHKIPPELRDEVKFLVLDEAHMMCRPTAVEPILLFQPKYLLAMTATLERHRDSLEEMIYMLCGKEIIDFQAPKNYTVFFYHTGLAPTYKCNAHGDPDYGSILENLYSDNLRNQIIVSLVDQYVDEHRIMVATRRKQHAPHLANLLEEKDMLVDYIADKKSTFTDCDVLVFNIQKAGTGFDVLNKCPEFTGEMTMIILTVPFRDTSLLQQVIGRIRNDNPFIIIMVDENKTLINQAKVCKRYIKKLKENGSTVQITDLYHDHEK